MAKNSPESGLRLDQLPDPEDRYSLGEKIGTGVSADVYEATDNQAGGKRVAVKVLFVERDALDSYQEEYQVLRDLSHHPNLPDFYGIYLKKGKPRSGRDQLWFVMELCEGGTVMDLVRGLHLKNKKMCEEHIAFILKETIKSLVHLHERHVMHRDVKGSNILLTKEGEVKLVDFGLSRKLKNTLDRRSTIVGSPCWMAPEVINCSQKEGDSGAYDNRVDVWAIGITAIELGDGKPPFQDMHPTRALFQIMRNPPPTLYRPANWTQDYNDFISECLEKNPEHRPYIMELMEHPFITALPENDYHFAQELKALLDDVAEKGRSTRLPESNVRKNLLETGQNSPPQMMHTEDLAALDQITEDTILVELHERLKQGHSHTFVGDVLLVINPNEEQNIYGLKHHVQYQFKSRSDNAPHIFAVADRAYQDAMHHEEPQYVLLAGETLSGKTTNFLHLLKHLSYLGKSGNGAGDKLLQAVQIVHAMGNAATPINPDSTRHMLQMEVTFTSTGKVSGGILWLFQLEKWRVTTTERHQANFHILYYFYDAMEADRSLERYHLDGGRRYRYLRTTKTEGSSESSHGPREDPQGNVSKFRDFQKRLAALDFDKEQQDTLWCLLAAILLLGEVAFKDTEDKKAAEIENPDVLADVARLLGVDEKKFNWALNNYCVVEKGTAVRRRHTRKEAEEARDVLARGIYFRLVDWVVNVINLKLSFTRAVFGDKYSICLIDLFGFECFKKNHLEQLIVNTLNEQLQYHYAQRVFVWEMQEQEEEEIPLQTLQFYDNKPTVDELMAKPDGLFYLLDEASRSSRGSEIIIETLEGDSKSSRLRAIGRHEFTVAHYTGKVTYDTTEMADKNRDFLPPEMIETLRLSSDRVVQKLFTNQLSKTGNLTVTAEERGALAPSTKGRWGSALMAGNQAKPRRYNTESHGEYSQTRRMRTASATFRSTSLEILRGLAVGAGSGGTHFVRCMRADLVGQPWGFQPEVVRQQLRALAVLETARARQKGYPHRVPFPEFIRRYKFLAFDFDETVDVTKENSRLLLVRLKMEGWVIGKSKVFLKYFNEEFLSRSYEMQVKKIIKVQTMMRAFLAKRNLAFKLRKLRSQDSVEIISMKDKENCLARTANMKITEESAVITIQKHYRGYQTRKHYGPLLKASSDKMNTATASFMRPFCKKWKAKSIFQVLLMYRSARYQDLVYFSQQVHLYNQKAMSGLQASNVEVILEKVDPGGRASLVLPKKRQSVWKLPFRLDDLPFFDTTFMCDPLAATGLKGCTSGDNDQESWDAPLRRGQAGGWRPSQICMKDQESQTNSTPDNSDKCVGADEDFIQIPYNRDPQLIADKERFSGSVQQKRDYNQTSQRKTTDDSPSNAQNYDYSRGVYKGIRKEPTSDAKNNRQFLRSDLPQPYRKKTSTVHNNSYGPVNNNDRFSRDLDNNPSDTSDSWDLPRTSSYGAKNEYNRQGSISPRSKLKNPLEELKMKGRQASKDDNDTDEPPFNFQAMLRKTKINRASLRRGSDQALSSDMASNAQHIVSSNKSTDKRRGGTVVYNSSIRSESPPPRYGCLNPWQDNRNKRIIEEMGAEEEGSEEESEGISVITTTTMLAPGLVVQGQVAEL